MMTRLVRDAGFRPLLVGATVSTTACYLAYAALTRNTPHLLVFVATVAGGLLISVVMTMLQTLAFSEIPKPLMGQATALSTMAQQFSFSLGILFAVELLHLAVWSRGGTASSLVASDFSLAFLVIALAVPLALPFFLRLPADVGAEFRGDRA